VHAARARPRRARRGYRRGVTGVRSTSARPSTGISPVRPRGRRRGVRRYDREAVGGESDGTTARPSAGSPTVRPRGRRRGVPGTSARPSTGSPTVRPGGRRRGVRRYDREAVGGESDGTTGRPSARSPTVRPRGRRRGVRRYDREAVGEESPVRPRGVGNPSQTLSVSEGESPLPSSAWLSERCVSRGNHRRFRTRTDDDRGLSPSLTLRVWLGLPTPRGRTGDSPPTPRGRTGDSPPTPRGRTGDSPPTPRGRTGDSPPTASRSYRGLPADGLAVVPSDSAPTPLGRTGDSPPTPRGRTVGLPADGLAVVPSDSSLTASRSYRGYPRRRPRARTPNSRGAKLPLRCLPTIW